MRQPLIPRQRAAIASGLRRKLRRQRASAGGQVSLLGLLNQDSPKTHAYSPRFISNVSCCYREDAIFCSKGPPVSLLKGTAKMNIVFNDMFQTLLKNEICEKGDTQFHPQISPFDATSRNLPNCLVR